MENKLANKLVQIVPMCTKTLLSKQIFEIMEINFLKDQIITYLFSLRGYFLGKRAFNFLSISLLHLNKHAFRS